MSILPKLVYSKDNVSNSPGFSIYTDCEEDGCTKINFCILGKWRTFAWDGYRFIKPLEYVSKGPYSKDTVCKQDVEYGISFNLEDGYIHCHYGPNDNGLYDEYDEKVKLLPLGWQHYRHKYHRLLDLNGQVYKSVTENYNNVWEDEYNHWEDSGHPTVKYNVIDKEDGTKIIATCKVEERCWTRGDRGFEWMAPFCKEKVKTYLEVEFSDEIGPKKGSWKGGTVGTSIEIKEHETIDMAFLQLCKREGLILGIQKIDDEEEL